MQFVRPATPNPRCARRRLQLLDLRPAGHLSLRRYQFVGVVLQLVALRQGAQLPVQLGTVEHAGGHGELELESEGRHEALTKHDDLVELAFIDFDHDLFALNLGADHRQVVSGALQEAEQLRRHRSGLGRRGARVLREIENAPVEELVEQDVAVELHEGPLRNAAGEGNPRTEKEKQRRRLRSRSHFPVSCASGSVTTVSPPQMIGPIFLTVVTSATLGSWIDR